MAFYEHFSEKFPEQFTVIRAIAQRDGALRAALADYEEISTWLATQEPARPREPDELKRAYKLVRDLEDEILNHLEQQDKSIS